MGRRSLGSGALMPLIKDWQPSDPLQLLVYGKFKIGKTWGALTFPRPVFFDFDRGVATARNPDFVKEYGLRWVFYETFEEKNLRKGIPFTANAFFDAWMSPRGVWTSTTDGKKYEVGRDQFDTFVLDSATSLSEIAQHKAVIVLGGMKLSKTHEQAISTGVLVPRIQDYGSERSLVEQFIDMLLGSGQNVIVLCHERELLDDAGNITGIVPLLTGKSVEAVPVKFNEVYNLRSRMEGPNVKRYIQTKRDALRNVGSRYGIGDGTEWNFNAIHGALSKIKDEQRKQLESSERTAAK